RTLEAQTHQDLPFEQVVELVNPPRSLAHSPLFQASFTWNNNETATSALVDLYATSINAFASTAKHDLALHLGEADGMVRGGLEFATSLFTAESAERYLGYLRLLLQAMVANDALPVAQLTMLGEADRCRLVEWNTTDVAYPSNASVHTIFEQQVATTPHAIAAVHEETSLTYCALNAQANRLAHYLRRKGVKPDTLVAICMERSIDMVVGLLAVLKAGGGYVPLDPAYPVERLVYMLTDSAPVALLTHGALDPSLRAMLDVGPAALVDLNADSADWADEDAGDFNESGVLPTHLAYVIYTSGSTGRPKGVMNEHRAVVNRLQWMQDAYRLTHDDAVLQKTPFSFDVSVWELFWPLLNGAKLVMARAGGHKDPAYLTQVIREQEITTLHFVPSMLQSFLTHPEVEACTTLRRIVCSGEALPGTLARQCREALPHARLTNLYGPTEAAVDVTAWECSGQDLPDNIPIGRPIANTRIYLLDPHGQPVPQGVAGEIYIGGVQVARGYLNRDELTAERFLPDPFAIEAGARMYRTGDLGRYLADGSIVFLGRNDHQVKLRGFRIELGEIEARLQAQEGMREALVLAREDQPGDMRLVAYMTAEAQIDTHILREALSAVLPEYMVPAAFVQLQSLPLTPNGKLDRNALPAPDGTAYASGLYEAPIGEIEHMLAGIWAELLNAEHVGRHDNFFALGGHSLLGVKMIARVRQALGVELDIGQLFEAPVLSALSEKARHAALTGLPPIGPADRAQALELSFAQQRLWFLAQMQGVSDAYHLPIGLRLVGELDQTALRAALDRLVARHEVLRTTFILENGRPVQRVADRGSGFALQEHDLRDSRLAGQEPEQELARIASAEAGAPFQLDIGPLARGRLIRLADREYVLLLTLHHIISDGWSMGVLAHEVGSLYRCFREGRPDPLPPLTIQYVDYAVWQRRWMEDDALQAQAAYWRDTLAGAPPLLELPTDRARPPQADHAGAFIPFELDAALVRSLQSLARRHDCTLFMTVLTAWATLLGRLSGQEDLVIGVPVANRPLAEVEPLIGFFVNTLALRIDLSGRPSVARLMQDVRARTLRAQQNQNLPFEHVVELVNPPRSMAYSPLFQAMLAWQHKDGSAFDLPGLQAETYDTAQRTAKFDLTLTLGETDKGLSGGFEYATALFDPATIERYAGYLRRLLQEMAAHDMEEIAALPLLGDDERRLMLLEWNATHTHYPAQSCMHQLFELQVHARPDKAAIRCGDTELSYQELNAQANRLAHHLRRHGVLPDSRVAICAERGPEMVVGVLAVLKAGGAYVPLDPAYPAERLAFMIKDSAPVAMLINGAVPDALRADLPELRLPVFDLKADTLRWESEASENPDCVAVDLRPDHLAYVIYTSGSTGKPKGVMVEHRSVCNLVAAQRSTLDIGPDAEVLQFASFSFDASVFELVMALCNGAVLHMPEADIILAGRTLADLVERHAISHLTVPPVVLAGLPDDVQLSSVRTLIVAGDASSAELVRRWGRRRRYINAYGPTENTVWASLHVCDPDFDQSPPIGRPIANTRIYILDPRGEPVPTGVIGEIHIAGNQVARGYLNRPELTAERFVPDLFAGDPAARMYKTGDLGRYNAQGEIEFIGRNDFQVKVRGFRIELGEIEARLRAHSAVRDAAVLARDDSTGDKRLVAYYICNPDRADHGGLVDHVDAEGLRAHMVAALPDHMVPSVYIALEAFPLTPNGKLHHAALPQPDSSAFATRAYHAPVGAVELALARIWADLLNVEKVGRNDHFFELGGHSLMAVSMVERMAREDLQVDVRVLFMTPTLADLAAATKKVKEFVL
ncbi:amino acid adenylation domain-containing protein, partial [Noviherbaspirillum sp.]|uniref:amino acid adenylation domain-containing protein n=1 Tax=Noviherbaspirillum sp. TaxID=1926288 RepID=UPI002FE123A0